MSGLLNIFQNDQFGLGDSAHSRKLKGNSNLEVEFVAYNVVGAAQELHTLITAPLPYKGGAAGPINDTQ
tara:strand:- start:128 stop:334 length:207 start_codon:yes stop_codon:yes gene_type:complete